MNKDMIISAQAVVNAVGISMFVEDYNVEPVILKETKDLKQILQDNIYNYEYFHGTINSVYNVWSNILNYNFKKIIDKFNLYYISYQIKLEEDRKNMINMASKYDADQLDSSIDRMFISQDNLNSLASAINKTRISSRKRPSRKSILKK